MGAASYTFSSRADCATQEGATIVPNSADGLVAGGLEAWKGSKTHRALQTADHRRSRPSLGYDQASGNHYDTGQPRPPDDGILNIRSGDPGDEPLEPYAIMTAPFHGDGILSSVSFSYRYVVGYGASGGKVGARVSLAFHGDMDCHQNNVSLLYNSSRHLLPSFDKCSNCYSDPVTVNLTGLHLNTSQPSALAFHFDNGQHNLQLLLPITFSLGWDKAGSDVGSSVPIV